jgi:hypothetical protein
MRRGLLHSVQPKGKRLIWYGWLGTLVVLGAETLLFLRQPFVGRWFTQKNDHR